MMPGRLLSLIELFGYKGDRKVGLQLLYRAGGWRKGSSEGPGVSKGACVGFPWVWIFISKLKVLTIRIRLG